MLNSPPPRTDIRATLRAQNEARERLRNPKHNRKKRAPPADPAKGRFIITTDAGRHQLCLELGVYDGADSTAARAYALAIVSDVCKRFGISQSEIWAATRREPFITARQELTYLLRIHTDFSLDRIGKWTGGRDKATVRSNIRAHCKRHDLTPLTHGCIAHTLMLHSVGATDAA